MDFTLSEEQQMLSKSARDFLKKECPKQLVQEMEEDEKGYSPELWRKMSTLGWQGLVLPEQYNGLGMDFLDLVVLLEEMGRACLPGPFLSTTLSALTILKAGSEQQKQEFLPRIASGDLIVSLAITESDGSYLPESINLGVEQRADGYVVNGTKTFVPDANVADYIICVVRTGNGELADSISLLMVSTRAKQDHERSTLFFSTSLQNSISLCFMSKKLSSINLISLIPKSLCK